jgi:hypothetical protein
VACVVLVVGRMMTTSRKWLPLVVAIVLPAGAVAGCGGGTNPQQVRDLEQSQSTFEDLEQQSSGYYQYRRTSVSWVGWYAHTTITVQDGVVIQREYQDGWQEEVPPEEGWEPTYWIEGAEEIGTHEGGHAAVTLDALYDLCADDVLVQDPAENEIYLSFFDDGVVKQCGYVPNDCADDCLSGFTLEYVDFGLPAPCDEAGGSDDAPQTCG